ncbi:hypothetical protein A9W98_33765 [Mycobacterium gordonae]|uniref:Transketolase N-terminal domain-containing protein n=1 Tax=Mycobacterium gordonae TaxID=1778 RepID=A0A1A6B8K6_MYCGO|nr:MULTISPECIES: transketolase [Mycobacteriaceae]OBR98657.1 hypothetical protein A9W98_33765 [Mycobacterium gordonae]
MTTVKEVTALTRPNHPDDWMRHGPGDAHWIGPGSFVLSVGHSSLTPYIQLYLGTRDESP